ncbi:hypothetical protein [Alicyclobacillus dauci]|uniref:Uncharacterized protein n=1 Tax=Alicyclobacillus dauci TaxID=1475485 RepID=A0ABY6ZBQ3_9BACL|nr:hypothetical protein [Alicyclobacillus dauci]WAH39530.1 hypothetical protein NZD86_23875 [Alicyclobacillus dauci]
MKKRIGVLLGLGQEILRRHVVSTKHVRYNLAGLISRIEIVWIQSDFFIKTG